LPCNDFNLQAAPVLAGQNIRQTKGGVVSEKKEKPIPFTRQDIKDMLHLLNSIPNSSPGYNEHRFKDTYAICSFLGKKLKESEV
jgi:hypothetical protein